MKTIIRTAGGLAMGELVARQPDGQARIRANGAIIEGTEIPRIEELEAELKQLRLRIAAMDQKLSGISRKEKK